MSLLSLLESNLTNVSPDISLQFLPELKGTRILQAVLSLTIGCKISAVIAWRRLEAMLALGKVESLVIESSQRCEILGNYIPDSMRQSRKPSRNQNFPRPKAVDKASTTKHPPQSLEFPTCKLSHKPQSAAITPQNDQVRQRSLQPGVSSKGALAHVKGRHVKPESGHAGLRCCRQGKTMGGRTLNPEPPEPQTTYPKP